MVGDGETAALISRDGSVDWLCWPRFDSAACFAALLGTRRTRSLAAARRGEVRSSSRRYVETASSCETEMRNSAGQGHPHRFHAAAGYGLGPGADRARRPGPRDDEDGARHPIRLRRDRAVGDPAPRDAPTELCAIAGPDMLTLRTSVPLRGEDLRTVAEFEVAAGESVAFVLTYCASHLPPPPPIDVEAALQERCEYLAANGRANATSKARGAKRSCARSSRSKALIYAPTGGIVAAPDHLAARTMGGERNWDYRYCWLRDATFTLLSLMNAGYFEEAAGVARLAGARTGGCSGAGADHVRSRRRAAPHRVGSRLAARL